MAKYCNPQVLESTWWAWILSDHLQQLESIRETGLLWTQSATELGTLVHCVASTTPCRFTSEDGIIDSRVLNDACRASFYPLDIRLCQRLAADNYQCEIPAEDSWETLTSLIYKVCCGVVLNFRPPSDDIREELIQEAFTHTLSKIQRGKLKFTPGKAPPFNLLTTAIFRIMYSIKNKEKRDRDRRSLLTEQLLAGVRLPDLNSIKVSKSLVGQCQH